MTTVKVRDLQYNTLWEMEPILCLYVDAGSPVSITLLEDGTYRMRVYAFRAGGE